MEIDIHAERKWKLRYAKVDVSILSARVGDDNSNTMVVNVDEMISTIDPPYKLILSLENTVVK